MVLCARFSAEFCNYRDNVCLLFKVLKSFKEFEIEYCFEVLI